MHVKPSHTQRLLTFLAAVSLLFGLFGYFPRLALAAPQSQTSTPAVRVNQVGYLPNLSKLATVVNSSTTPLTWQLRNSANTVVASGTTTIFGNDAASGDHVHIADFSAYTTSGTGYTVQVGSAVSNPFDISAAVYDAMKYDALAYFYHNRSGIAITLPYAGGSQWTRPAGHINVSPNQGDNNVPCAAGTGCSYSLDVRGGWYDAGDHGKYVVNGGISVWTLLNQYERAKFLGGSLADFGDGHMSIPENANGVPDLLDEARWELEFMLRMQVPAGQPLAGMVHHKMHDQNWTGLPTRPEQDSQPRILRPPSTAATLNLAATAAQCARIWQTIDSAFANRCLTAAQTAWTAAQANPSMLAPSSDGNGGGAYSDNNVQDEFYWAAAELYITTGNSTYLNFLTGSPHYKSIPPDAMAWPTTQALGNISLAVVPNGLASAEIASLRTNIAARANTYLTALNAQGYRVPFSGGTGGSYFWGSNSAILNNAIILALAYDFTQEARYLNGAAEAMNYMLGRNGLSRSYVSGYGENPMQNPHHRFWAFQANSSFPRPPRGALAGGANSGLEDPYAQANLQGCAPQKCYVDHIESYSTNEVAINWNAPLAWVAAFLDEKAGSSSTPTPTPTGVTVTPTRTSTPTNTPTFTPTQPNGNNTGWVSPSGQASQSGGDGNGFQSSPTNAFADGGGVATDTDSGNGTSTSCTSTNKDRHAYFNYPLSIPAGSAITGLEVRTDARADSTSGTPRFCVQLSWNNGTSWTTMKTGPNLSTTERTDILGSSSDTWGRAWNTSELTSANLRVRIVSVASSTSRDFSLDWIPVRVWYSGGGTVTPTNTPTRTPTGTVTVTTPTFTPTRVTVTPTFTPTSTPTLSVGPCSPVTGTIAAPFQQDGAGTFCWQSSNLGTFVNSWNLESLTINGVDFTNKYVPASSYPPKINGFWYVSYKGSLPWSHFEAR